MTFTFPPNPKVRWQLSSCPPFVWGTGCVRNTMRVPRNVCVCAFVRTCVSMVVITSSCNRAPGYFCAAMVQPFMIAPPKILSALKMTRAQKVSDGTQDGTNLRKTAKIDLWRMRSSLLALCAASSESRTNSEGIGGIRYI